MQDFRQRRRLNGMGVHGRHPKTEYLHHAVPLHHDLGGLERLMDYPMAMGVVKRLTHLACDVLQVPNRKAVLAGQGRRH